MSYRSKYIGICPVSNIWLNKRSAFNLKSKIFFFFKNSLVGCHYCYIMLVCWEFGIYYHPVKIHKMINKFKHFQLGRCRWRKLTVWMLKWGTREKVCNATRISTTSLVTVAMLLNVQGHSLLGEPTLQFLSTRNEMCITLMFSTVLTTQYLA